MTDTLDTRALRDLSYGVYVVSSRSSDGKLNGQIANTAFQVCAEPPRLVVSINKENLTHEYISESGIYAVSILDTETPFTFIGLFGFKCGRDVDKCAETNYKVGTTGAPLILDHALSVLEVSVIDTLDAGTHTIFLGDIVAAQMLKTGTPLTYKYYHEVIKGKTPKKAATYQEEK
jgi:ferric-chelate reductase [NAD(P)H]